jgi:DNA-binding transcriptional regulator YiaG
MSAGRLYRYRGCGLDNVYLVNGYTSRKLRSGEEIVAIEDIAGLHRAIALMLIESAPALDGKQFRFLRKELELSQRAVALILGNDEQTISLWERRTEPVPQPADLVLRALAKETLSGHPELKKLIERFNSLDREQRAIELQLKFEKEADDGWILKCAA